MIAVYYKSRVVGDGLYKSAAPGVLEFAAGACSGCWLVTWEVIAEARVIMSEESA